MNSAITLLPAAFLLGASFIPAVPPAGRVGLAFLATVLVARGLASWGGGPNRLAGGDPDAGRPPVLVLLAILSPVWLLHSIASTFRFELGLRHPLTWLAGGIVMGVPVLAAFMVSRSRTDADEALRRAVLAVTSAALVLAGAEVGVRVIGADPGNATVSKRLVGQRPFTRRRDPAPMFEFIPGITWGHRYSSDPRGYFGKDRTVLYEINSAGFRDQEFSRESSPGVLRVALVGDSFGLGQGVHAGDTVADILEQILSRDVGCPVEIYNFSVWGYGTVQQARIFEETIAAYSPDLGIVWYFLNDVEVLGITHFLGDDEPAIFFPFLRRFLALPRLAGHRLDGWLRARQMVTTYLDGYEEEAEGWLGAREGLASISRVASREGIPLALFVHPIPYFLGEANPFARIHQKVMEEAARGGFSAFDLSEAFQGRTGVELWVHGSDQHPNELAHRLAAVYAAPRIAALLPACPAVPED